MFAAIPATGKVKLRTNFADYPISKALKSGAVPSDLVKLEAILAETVARCSDGDAPDCPVLDVLDAGRRTQGG